MSNRNSNDNRPLEDRLRDIEDRLEIYNLIASHPPSADTGADYFTRAAYMPDGEMDLAGGKGAKGNEAIAAIVKKPGHQKAIEQGLDPRAVCDLVNSSARDVQCNHSTTVSAQGIEPIIDRGEELVRANARQQIHSMLPQGLADGDYWVSFDVNVAGDISDSGGSFAGIHINVNGGVVTVIP